MRYGEGTSAFPTNNQPLIAQVWNGNLSIGKFVVHPDITGQNKPGSCRIFSAYLHQARAAASHSAAQAKTNNTQMSRNECHQAIVLVIKSAYGIRFAQV